MGSWIHDGFLDSPWVLGFLEHLRQDFRILDLLESIIGFNKSFVQLVGIEVKNKKARAHIEFECSCIMDRNDGYQLRYTFSN